MNRGPRDAKNCKTPDESPPEQGSNVVEIGRKNPGRHHFRNVTGEAYEKSVWYNVLYKQLNTVDAGYFIIIFGKS